MDTKVRLGMVRGVRYSLDKTYVARDTYAPTSPEWKALDALAKALAARAALFAGEEG